MPHCPVCKSTFEKGVQYCPNDGSRLLASDKPQFDPMVGLLLDERYRIIAPIGEGAMGRVYRACQVKVGRDVAVKVLNAQSSQDKTVVRRFESEAMIISRLKHPNTLKLFDFGETPDNRLFIVVELLEGRSLEQALNDGPLPQLETLRVLRQTLKALNEAHAAGIVHRDIKPANIMLELVGGTQVVKVLDFGIARMLSNVRHTATGGVVGTPAYMSPEQIRGLEVDHRSDLYSLGVVAYECLTGVLPFNAATPHAMMLEHTKVEPTPIRTRLPIANVRQDIDDFVLSLLQKIPEDRPASALAAVRLIDRLEQQLLQTRPETAPVSPVRKPRESTLPDGDAVALFELSEDTIPLADKLRRKRAQKGKKGPFFGKDHTQPEGASDPTSSDISESENTDKDPTDSKSSLSDLTPTDDPVFALSAHEGPMRTGAVAKGNTAEFGAAPIEETDAGEVAAMAANVEVVESPNPSPQNNLTLPAQPDRDSQVPFDDFDPRTGPNPVVEITSEEIKASAHALPATVPAPNSHNPASALSADGIAEMSKPVRVTGRQTSPKDGPEDQDNESASDLDSEAQFLADGPWKKHKTRAPSGAKLLSQLSLPADGDGANMSDTRLGPFGWSVAIFGLAALGLGLWHFWPKKAAETIDQSRPAFERTVKPDVSSAPADPLP